MDGAAALCAPVFEPAGAGRGRALVRGAARAVLAVLDPRRTLPLLVLVDDAQWADPASLAFLAYLHARRVEDLPVALAVASRPGEDEREEQLLEELLGQPSADSCAPPRSDRRPWAACSPHGRANQPDEAFVDACVAATEGNPFLVRAGP